VFKTGKLMVQVYPDYKEMSATAANDAGNCIKGVLNQKDEINIVFSGALSQQEFHKYLAKIPGIDWNRINAFSVDEFYCPQMQKSCTVAQQPIRDLYNAVNPKSINLINYKAENIEQECRRYDELIRNNPPDIACLGIGRSGHIALNEPGQTDFNDASWVRSVNIPQQSKDQLMKDPNFLDQGFIPDKGITITLPALMQSLYIFVVVPFKEKSEIIKSFFLSGITEALPATILKTKENATLYLDRESYSLVEHYYKV